jgi:hypothetical protein
VRGSRPALSRPAGGEYRLIYKKYHFDKVMPKSLINQIKYNGLYSVP